MISEGLKSNSTLTILNLSCDKKRKKHVKIKNLRKERDNGAENDINEINS